MNLWNSIFVLLYPFMLSSNRCPAEQGVSRASAQSLQQMPGSDKLGESHKMQIGDFFFSQAFRETYFPG